MKKIIFALLLSFSLFSCNNGDNKLDAVPAADSISIKSEIIKKDSTQSLGFISAWKGKTASEAGFFEDTLIQTRLIDLIGADEYTSLKSNWNVQTPFTEENGIYSASGCKQNDCPSYHAIFYCDTAGNNINLLIFKNKNSKIYTEKGEIDLPEQMKQEMQITKGNL